MDIVAAYEQVGTYRGAAALCGTTHKTVKRVIERRRAGEGFDAPRRELPKNTDAVATVIAEKVRTTSRPRYVADSYVRHRKSRSAAESPAGQAAGERSVFTATPASRPSSRGD